MTIVNDIYKAVDKIAPFKLAEKWDNSGLLIGDKNNTVTKVMLCLDITNEIVDEAVKKGANVLISHHPVIFNPLKRIDTNSLVSKLIKHDISAICAHTNLDMVKGGINDIIAQKLNLKIISEPIEIIYEDSYYQIAVFVPVENIEQVYQAMVKAEQELSVITAVVLFIPKEQEHSCHLRAHTHILAKLESVKVLLKQDLK